MLLLCCRSLFIAFIFPLSPVLGASFLEKSPSVSVGEHGHVHAWVRTPTIHEVEKRDVQPSTQQHQHRLALHREQLPHHHDGAARQGDELVLISSSARDVDMSTAQDDGLITKVQDAPPVNCPVCEGPVENVVAIKDETVTEISGMVLSERFPDITYVVVDSPTIPTVYAFSIQNGTRMAIFTLNIPDGKTTFGVNGWGDWESLATGPCKIGVGKTTRKCIFIGDMGQNCARESENCDFLRDDHSPQSLIQFYEPEVISDATLDDAIRIPFKFPNNEKYDAEGLMSYGDDLFVFTKEDTDSSRLFRFPCGDLVNFSNSNPAMLTLVATFELKSGEKVTGAVGEVGNGFVLRTYTSVLWFSAAHLPSCPTTGNSEPTTMIVNIASSCQLSSPEEKQGEAINWREDSTTNKWDFFTISEGKNSMIHKFECNRPEP